MLIQKQYNINFTVNQQRNKNTTVFFFIEDAKSTCCDSIVNLFCFNIVQNKFASYNSLNVKL